MASLSLAQINTLYPVAGQDNDTQGFRDNFTNIQTNFSLLSTAVSSLQGNSSVTPTITSVPVNLNGIGSAGQIAFNNNYFYVCTGVNTWIQIPTVTGSYANANLTSFLSTSNITVKNNIQISSGSLVLTNGNIYANTGVISLVNNSVSVGSRILPSGQGSYSIQIGSSAGAYNQGASAVAIGPYAGYSAQSSYAVAIGSYAGYNGQTTNAVAIGNNAGQSQTAASIILNSSGVNLNDGGRAGFMVSAVRNDATTANTGNVVTFNTSTSELTYTSNLNISTVTLSSMLQLPNLSTIQINSIGTKANGMTVFNGTTGNLQVWNGTKWANIVLN